MMWGVVTLRITRLSSFLLFLGFYGRLEGALNCMMRELYNVSFVMQLGMYLWLIVGMMAFVSLRVLWIFLYYQSKYVVI